MKPHPSMIVAALLVLMQSAALAQATAALPTSCPYGKSIQVATFRGGGFTTLSAGSGILRCEPKGCTNHVKVASYRPEYQQERCCSYIEYGTVVALKKPKKEDPSINLTWVLDAVDAGMTYVFGPVNPIDVKPTAQPDDFDPPSVKKGAKAELTLPSANNQFSVFNYALTIFRANGDGSYLACDPNDPVIVNQGN